MKQRDFIFVTIPIVILAIFAAVVSLLFVQHRGFKRAYISDAQDELRMHTELIADTLVPILRQKDAAKIQARLNSLKQRNGIRVTVIEASGKVIADTEVNAQTLGNHLNRPEIIAANAKDDFVSRYSTTVQNWLLYYAVQREGYYVRVSMPMVAITGLFSQMQLSVTLAIAFGVLAVLLVSFYLILRLRPHFIALQRAAVAIASGELNTHIDVPRSGLLHELAQAVASMANQLQMRIFDLQRERNEFDALFNTLQEPLLVISHTGEVLQRNRAASRLFGLPDDHCPFRIERTASVDLITYVRTAFQTVEIKEQELTFETTAGNRSLLVHGVRLERNHALCLLLLLTDLTDLHRLESFRTDFVANVSHEIKTPLTAILATVETLQENKLDALQTQRCMEILSRQSSRLNALVLDILSLAAIERRQGSETDFVTFRLDTLCSDAVALCSDDAERSNIEMTLVQPMPAVSVKGDPRLLEQAIINLITNAIRHSETKTIDVILQANATHAILRVRDQGIGIAEEHLPRLFERFYRIHKERSRATGGTGLGLAIVKHVALLHHATIDVQSTLGKGTVFTLTIPLTPSEGNVILE